MMANSFCFPSETKISLLIISLISFKWWGNFMFQTRWKVHHKENLVLERGMWAGQIPQDLRKHRGEVPGFSIFQIGCWRSLQARISNQSRPKQTKTKSKKNLFFLAKVPGKERNPVQQERNLFDSNWGPALDFGPPFCSCSQLGRASQAVWCYGTPTHMVCALWGRRKHRKAFSLADYSYNTALWW